jgi:hypothetical protein
MILGEPGSAARRGGRGQPRRGGPGRDLEVFAVIAYTAPSWSSPTFFSISPG